MGRLDVVKLLVENGADVNPAAIDSSRAPLPHASRHERLKVVKLLLERGADANQA